MNNLKEENISSIINLIRGQKIILDFHLASLYEVDTRSLKQSVKRNIERFPKDFMFTLTKTEIELMVSQNVIPSHKMLGGSNPMAFTEQGVAMLSGILRSKRAVEVNISIMRTFVYLRKIMQINSEIANKINELESKYKDHDEKLAIIYEAINQLLEEDESPQKEIGFQDLIFALIVSLFENNCNPHAPLLPGLTLL